MRFDIYKCPKCKEVNEKCDLDERETKEFFSYDYGESSGIHSWYETHYYCPCCGREIDLDDDKYEEEEEDDE